MAWVSRAQQAENAFVFCSRFKAEKANGNNTGVPIKAPCKRGPKSALPVSLTRLSRGNSGRKRRRLEEKYSRKLERDCPPDAQPRTGRNPRIHCSSCLTAPYRHDACCSQLPACAANHNRQSQKVPISCGASKTILVHNKNTGPMVLLQTINTKQCSDMRTWKTRPSKRSR